MYMDTSGHGTESAANKQNAKRARVTQITDVMVTSDTKKLLLYLVLI